jgi:catechol 2,3-dioxygenase-like lactoylglutathione lyase family enzyme
MALKILELHHHAVTMPTSALDEMGVFYKDVMGLGVDEGRWNIPGVPGYFLDLPDDTQIHLLGRDGPSRYAKKPDQDPVSHHVALAVENILEAEQELVKHNVTYWTLDNVASPELRQLFFRDPAGNILELHQIGRCRCKKSSRQFSDEKTKAASQAK